jgi:hypothetical protein
VPASRHPRIVTLAPGRAPLHVAAPEKRAGETRSSGESEAQRKPCGNRAQTRTTLRSDTIDERMRLVRAPSTAAFEGCPAMTLRLVFPISVALAGLAGIAHAGPLPPSGDFVVTQHSIDRGIDYRAAPTPARPAGPPRSVRAAEGGVCGVAPVAWQGQPLPDGESGTLDPVAFFNSATLNNSGRIAFVASVTGADRNQGVFTADADGLHIVMLGCGEGGGSGVSGDCGDPTPLGGTFGGVFQGTFGTPAINDNGDVLFLADVAGGSSPRGLFLYEAASDTIVKVAAEGDPSPEGGTFTMLGMGSLDSAGTVVFLAGTDGSQTSDIFLWQDGVVTKYVAAGDPVPGGGTFEMLGTEQLGFADGSFVAGGPIPAIDEAGEIAFRGIVSGVPGTDRGLFVSTGGVHEWLVRAGDDAPDSGTFIDFQAPSLNANGEIAFFSDTSETSAWFAGGGASWRRIVAFNEEIEGGTVDGLAFSRNPMNTIADNGDVVVWVSRLVEGNDRGTTMVVHPDSSVTLLAVQGDDTGFGGIWGGSMDAWPSINDVGQVRMGSATPGFGDALTADVVFTLCGDDTIFADGFEGPPPG